MRGYLGFLKTSSMVVKITAWVVLFFGLAGGISVLMGRVPGVQPITGLIAIGLYAFAFFFFYLVAKIADLLIKIINEIKKE